MDVGINIIHTARTAQHCATWMHIQFQITTVSSRVILGAPADEELFVGTKHHKTTQAPLIFMNIV